MERAAACPGVGRAIAALPSACTPGKAELAELPHEGTKLLRDGSGPPLALLCAGKMRVFYACAQCRCPVDWGTCP